MRCPDALGGAQPHRGGARVGRDLGVGGRLGAAGQQPQLRVRARPAAPAGPTGVVSRGQRGEGLLDDAVLQRLVGQHDDPAADAQRVERGRNGGAQRVQLAVDLDAQRLEGALGRVAAVAAGRGRDRRRAPARPAARSRSSGAWRARAVDGLGDPQGEALLAVLAQHPGQLGDRVAVDDLGRR